MPCERKHKISFFCQKCKRIITSYAVRSRIQAVRRHYWKHHRPTMLKGK